MINEKESEHKRIRTLMRVNKNGHFDSTYTMVEIILQ